jgi:beta-glucanase (GH16 family)
MRFRSRGSGPTGVAQSSRGNPARRLLPGLVLVLVCACSSAEGTGAATAAPIPTPSPTASATPGAGSFDELVFSDEFDGPAVDLSKWKVHNEHQDLWPESPWRRNFKKENVYIQDGALVIRTTKEKVGFSTGAIGTGNDPEPALFEQAFGRYEARMRFSTQQGFGCAFWLWNTSETYIDGSGRDGSEIDILEDAWLIDRVDHAIHWDGYGAEHQSAVQWVNGMGLDDGGWHVARLDWYPDEYRFFIDDKETWRTQAGGVSQAPNFVILSCEIVNYGTGPEAMGVGPIEDARLPDYFYVDYVRVWRYRPPQ